MNDLKDIDYFKEKYPHFFSKELIEFYCLDGWADLLDAAFCLISQTDDSFKLIQVKEKFGGLTVYSIGRRQSKELCNWIMDASYGICSKCNSRDEVTKEGRYLVTLCKKCREKEK